MMNIPQKYQLNLKLWRNFFENSRAIQCQEIGFTQVH